VYTEFDDADREAGRQIACPVLVPWAGRGGLPSSMATCSRSGVRGPQMSGGGGVDASHFLAEDRPEETAAELLAFLPTPST
jgi:haloacetate dehalogenase